MRRIIVLILAIICTSLIQQFAQETPESAQLVCQIPSGSTLEINASYNPVYLDSLIMGDGSTIRVRGIPSWKVQIAHVRIGNNCKIDVRGEDGPDKSHDFRPNAGVAKYCDNGDDDSALFGFAGGDGTRGPDLFLTWFIESIGSCEILTQGGRGGIGGPGGQGKKGGDARCYCSAGNGGKGGQGGSGGRGGDESYVELKWFPYFNLSAESISINGLFERSTGGTGGVPGPGGPGGQGGAGGCTRGGGSDGWPGDPGSPGASGRNREIKVELISLKDTNTLGNIASIFQAHGHYQLGLDWYNRARAACIKLGDYRGEVIFLLAILEIMKKTNDFYGEGITQYDIGSCILAECEDLVGRSLENCCQNSLFYLRRALDIFRKLGNKEYERKTSVQIRIARELLRRVIIMPEA